MTLLAQLRGRSRLLILSICVCLHCVNGLLHFQHNNTSRHMHKLLHKCFPTGSWSKLQSVVKKGVLYLSMLSEAESQAAVTHFDLVNPSGGASKGGR